MISIRKILTLVVTGALCSATARAETLTLGVIGPLTGPGAPWGKAFQGAMRLAAAEVNAQGGLEVGGKKYMVKIASYDDKYTANEAVAAYNRLIQQDGVHFLAVGPSTSTMALKQTIERDDVVSLTASFSRRIFDPTTKHLFRILTTSNDYVPAVAAWMREHMRERRIVFVNPNDETGWDQTELCERVFREKGFEVVGHELFERSILDFQPLLTKLLALKPEIIEVGSTAPGQAGLLVRQAREMGFRGRFTKLSAPAPKDIVKAAGAKAAEGLINVLNADPENPGWKKLAAAYRASEGHEPNDCLAPYYDGVRIMMRAIQAAGTVADANKVAAGFSKALPMKSVQGEQLTLGGKALYGVDGQVIAPVYIAEIHNGEIVVVGKTN